MEKYNSIRRRQFLKLGAGVFLIVPLSQIVIRSLWAAGGATEALPAGQAPVAENDPVAMAIGFHHDAKKTDFTKYPQRKKPEAKNQYCENCTLFTGVNKSWGKCQMMVNGLVSTKGWCGSYNKKA